VTTSGEPTIKAVIDEYSVTATTDQDGAGGLMVGHDRCTWYERIDAVTAPIGQVVSMALEHRIAGCRRL
jgi:hypothetical protein